MGYMLPNIYRYLNMTSEEVILNKCSLKHNYTHGMQKHIFALLGHFRVFTQNMNNSKIYYFHGTFNDAKKSHLSIYQFWKRIYLSGIHHLLNSSFTSHFILSGHAYFNFLESTAWRTGGKELFFRQNFCTFQLLIEPTVVMVFTQQLRLNKMN